VLSEFALILVIVFILFCLFVVLVERKFLAHAQRRFGPSIAGRNGYFQIILDLVKLATKELLILPNALTSFVPALISLFFVNQILFIQNFIFAPSLMFLYNIDGIIFFHLILVMGSNIVLIFIGFLSQSKYSLIGVFRGFVHVVSLDVYVTVLYVLLVWLNSSGNFHDYAQNQLNAPTAVIFAPLFFLFLVVLLLESKRAPFDHVETETEVVAGYATEYSGIYLLTFYLVEYFHLIISANHFVILFLGG
jgi:NADH:ubiquinone oxidoreductase subunit H